MVDWKTARHNALLSHEVHLLNPVCAHNIWYGTRYPLIPSKRRRDIRIRLLNKEQGWHYILRIHHFQYMHEVVCWITYTKEEESPGEGETETETETQTEKRTGTDTEKDQKGDLNYLQTQTLPFLLRLWRVWWLAQIHRDHDDCYCIRDGETRTATSTFTLLPSSAWRLPHNCFYVSAATL